LLAPLSVYRMGRQREEGTDTAEMETPKQSSKDGETEANRNEPAS